MILLMQLFFLEITLMLNSEDQIKANEGCRVRFKGRMGHRGKEVHRREAAPIRAVTTGEYSLLTQGILFNSAWEVLPHSHGTLIVSRAPLTWEPPVGRCNCGG